MEKANVRIVVGCTFALLGIIAVVAALLVAKMRTGIPEPLLHVIVIGGFVTLIGGGCTVLGYIPEQIRLPGGSSITIREESWRPVPVPPSVRKELAPDARKDKQALLPTLPGARPGDYKLFEAPQYACLKLSPTSMTPSYSLDREFRIVDWNKAVSLAFDFTMEGFRGQTVAEWVFFLANYKEVAKRGIEAFKDKKPEDYPNINVEELRFKSDRYDMISATKRAYKVPDDQGKYAGWIVLLDLAFASALQTEQYTDDLIATIRDDLIWTEYALAYDVLKQSKVYSELLEIMLGKSGPLSPIAEQANVLDLGAGTGNLTEELIGPERIIFAVENNATMLEILKQKCAQALRFDDKGAGVIPVRQDINSLFGLPKNYFHCALLNNVLYAIRDPLPCLKATYERLCDGGEIRVGGPHKSTDLSRLLRVMEKELSQRPDFDNAARQKFEKIRLINEMYLKPRLNRWTIEELCDLLKAAGFREITGIVRAYAGQAVIVAARK